MCSLFATLFRCAVLVSVAEEPVILTIRLAEDESVVENASKFHGIRNDDCASGAMFEEVARRLGKVLEKPRARDICHNLIHEVFVFCREQQKRGLGLPGLTTAIVAGECTSQMTRDRSGVFTKLSAAYQMLPDSPTVRAHDAGQEITMANQSRSPAIS